MNNKISLKEAVKFHGHLGPYLVLGVLAGEMALKKLRCDKYFGLKVSVWGAGERPKSCLIDGLQLATGATYGKGNITKRDGKVIKVKFLNRTNNRIITLRLKDNILRMLEEVKTHRGSEVLARKLHREDCEKLFNIAGS